MQVSETESASEGVHKNLNLLLTHSFLSIWIGPFTALIPTNEAFADLDDTLLDQLLDPANTDDLRNFLLYHILPGATLTTELTAGPTETLFPDNTIDVGVDPVQFNGADLITGDIVACNGYVNSIGTVLNPFAGSALGRKFAFLSPINESKTEFLCLHFCVLSQLFSNSHTLADDESRHSD